MAIGKAKNRFIEIRGQEIPMNRSYSSILLSLSILSVSFTLPSSSHNCFREFGDECVQHTENQISTVTSDGPSVTSDERPSQAES